MVNLYSPYGPRPRRSKQLVVVWMSCLLGILFLTWYITSRHRESARTYADLLLKNPDPKLSAEQDPA